VTAAAQTTPRKRLTKAEKEEREAQANAEASVARVVAHEQAIRLRRFGTECAPHSPIPVDVWARTLDEKGEETGYVARVKGRTLGAIVADIKLAFAALDTEGEHGRQGETFDSEGIHAPSWQTFRGQKGNEIEWPERARGVACYAVTGGSEGHYVHVDVTLPDHHPEVGCRSVLPVFLCKTFQGMAHAQKMAAKLAELLGA
jgi:hypothetical protein